MPMTQECIRRYYEGTWKEKSESAATTAEVAYSSPVEDAVVYPLYRQMIADLKIRAAGGEVLDVGSGSGRWIRFFLEHFQPRTLVGTDYTLASVQLLNTWFAGSDPARQTHVEFQHADITDPNLQLGRQFDLINIANVLFHIPEPELFARALANLARHVKPDGTIVTTEYLPRLTMRTEWMLVRDRYLFEAAVRAAGLRIVAIKAFGIFANNPMGLDGPDSATRRRFHKARTLMNQLGSSVRDERSMELIVSMFVEIEEAILSFGRERIAEIDMPSQKLVFLARVNAGAGASESLVTVAAPPARSHFHSDQPPRRR